VIVLFAHGANVLDGVEEDLKLDYFSEDLVHFAQELKLDNVTLKFVPANILILIHLVILFVDLILLEDTYLVLVQPVDLKLYLVLFLVM